MAGDARLFLETLLWIVRPGSPWRDLPVSFGWNWVSNRFRDWVKAGVFKRIFGAILDDPNTEVRDDRRQRFILHAARLFECLTQLGAELRARAKAEGAEMGL